MPRELRNSPTFPEIVEQCLAVLLHTSESMFPFILVRDANGKIYKLDGDSDDASAVQNRLRFVRIFRKEAFQNIISFTITMFTIYFRLLRLKGFRLAFLGPQIL